MFIIIKFFFTVFIFSFLPSFLILASKKVSFRTNLIVSIGIAPLILGAYNSINLLLNLTYGYLDIVIPFVVTSFVVYKYKGTYYSLKEYFKYIKILIVAVILSICYWLVMFYPFYKDGELYCDVMWNISLINMFKNEVLPYYPVWDEGHMFFYHYLTNYLYAGISNISGIGSLELVVKCSYLSTVFSIISIILISARRYVIQYMIILIMLLFYSFSYKWAVYESFVAHISGYCASTFFWALPSFLSSIYLYDFIRRQKRIKVFTIKCIVLLFITIIIGFGKSTNLVILCFLELFYFLNFLIRNYRFLIKKYKELISYAIIPIISLIIITILSIYHSSSIILGIQMNDFVNFESWNFLFPIIAIYGVIIIYTLFNRVNVSKHAYLYLLIGFLNLILMFLTKHSGNSDIYFGFNTLICNAIFFIITINTNSLKYYVASYIIVGFCIFIGVEYFQVKGFSVFDFSIEYNNSIRHGNYNFRNIEIEELNYLGAKIPSNSLVIVPKQEKTHTVIFSAFLGRRIWNESERYAYYVYNTYSIVTKYLNEESFFPSYLYSEKPSIKYNSENYMNWFVNNSGYDKFQNLPNPELRFQVYNKLVFSDISEEEFYEIIDRYSITHILLKEKEYSKANRHLKKLDRINSKTYSISVI